MIWQADYFEKVLMSGRTQPLVLGCSPELTASESSSPASQQAQRIFVVKAIGLPEVNQWNLFNELCGNRLARRLGIETPEPSLVNISQEFIDALSSLSSIEHRPQAGLAVGCEYFKGGFATPVIHSSLTMEEATQATSIYAYDLLVQNPDRRTGRPNCAFHGKRIIAYDFEMSFSFLFAILQKGEPWQVSLHGLAQDHFFRGYISKHEVNWRPFISAVRLLDDAQFKEVFEDIPNSWEPWAERVRDHVMSVAMNSDQFELELQRSLL
jgi:hypothetical protein